MPKVTIDGHSIDVPEGTSILQAARMIGGNIVPPAMCYYSSLPGTGGKCRTCLVEVTKGSEKDPRPMPKLVPSCSTTVMDGMEVGNTTSPRTLEARKGVVEFLLINHPLDCPVCDQAGECELQNLSFKHGAEKTRYEEDRRTYPVIDIGDKIKLHMNRCILCYRCVHVADQLTTNREHGVLFRGDKSEISTYIKEALDEEFIGNVIDVCPVGALTDKTFRFKSRVWFTRPMDAHRDCDKCCGQVVLWMSGNEILRVTARKDRYGEIKDTPEGKSGYICNTCRYDKKDINDWTIEGPRNIEQASVIAQNLYNRLAPKDSYHQPINDIRD